MEQAEQFRVTLAQFEVVRGEPAKNLEAIEGFADEARTARADLLCLPEMCTTGFQWRRNRELLPTTGDTLASVGEMARGRGIAIAGSFLEALGDGRMANTLHLFDASGAVILRYPKIHCFTVFGEDRHIDPGTKVASGELKGRVIGASICYDLRFPELYRALMSRGVAIQLVPSAFPHPRLAHWRHLLRARAIENQMFVVATNQCGREGIGGRAGEVRYLGHSSVIDPWGETLFEADEKPCAHTVDLDFREVAAAREKMPALADRRSDLFSLGAETDDA